MFDFHVISLFLGGIVGRTKVSLSEIDVKSDANLTRHDEPLSNQLFLLVEWSKHNKLSSLSFFQHAKPY